MSSNVLYEQYKANLERINAQIALGPESVTDEMIVAFHKESPQALLNEMDINGEDLQYMLSLVVNILNYVQQRRNSIEADLCEIRTVGMAMQNYGKQMR